MVHACSIDGLSLQAGDPICTTDGGTPLVSGCWYDYRHEVGNHECDGESADKDVRRLKRRLRRCGEFIFTSLDYTNVAFENNFAERQTRPTVILRKNSQSNRSQRGAATQAILTSIYRTLRLRGLNPTRTITDVLKTYLATGSVSPLPAAQTADG